MHENRKEKLPHETYAQWIKRKSCTDKIAYDTPQEANLTVLNFWKSGSPNAGHYRCKHCGKLHVTRGNSATT